MDEYNSAKDFLRRMDSGEFDGRLYETIANLPADELQQIVALAAERQWPSIAADAPKHTPAPRV